MALYIITGPPAAGKTTYIETHAKPGDIRIDYDAIANTLTGSPANNHEHKQHTKTVAEAARDAAMQAAI
ncbi:MAG TPA: ATP-binding protein [Corynebacterium kroppenstedtii]|nr:ATP-binding protein [Corynebacterium kroppenstedtii]